MGEARSEPLPAYRVLDWDSEYFGYRVGRVESTTLGPEEARCVRAWAVEQNVSCVYFLADAGDPASAHAAEAVGFRMMDVRVTLARLIAAPLPPAPPEFIEPAQPTDEPALREIARVSHRESRFYADPGFAREQCDGLYERWIAGACAGDADAVFVARSAGEASGYLSVHRDPESSGHIGLVAVAEAARGRAFGKGLVAASLHWFAAAGCRSVRVATQGRNTGALRLYERAGFTTERVEIWFHLWTDASGAAV